MNNFESYLFDNLLIKKIVPDSDERGMGFDPQLNFDNIKMSHIVTVKKNKIRGNHYHKEQIETIVILEGEVEMKFSYADEKLEFFKPENEVYIIIIKPGVVHSFKNLSENKSVFVCFSDVKLTDDTVASDLLES